MSVLPVPLLVIELPATVLTSPPATPAASLMPDATVTSPAPEPLMMFATVRSPNASVVMVTAAAAFWVMVAPAAAVMAAELDVVLLPAVMLMAPVVVLVMLALIATPV